MCSLMDIKYVSWPFSNTGNIETDSLIHRFVSLPSFYKVFDCGSKKISLWNSKFNTIYEKLPWKIFVQAVKVKQSNVGNMWFRHKYLKWDNLYCRTTATAEYELFGYIDQIFSKSKGKHRCSFVFYFGMSDSGKSGWWASSYVEFKRFWRQ